MKTENDSERMTDKAILVRNLADHVIEVYAPHETPCVLMWRETVNRFLRATAPGSPEYRRDDKFLHEHWKRYGPGVCRELEERYKVTVVRINKLIRKLVDHGGEPKLGGRRDRDVTGYRRCLPHSAAPTFGIACFPRDVHKDHPLVVAKLERRGQAAANGLLNATVSIDRAQGYGVLTDESGEKIRDHMKPIVRKAIENRYPLFRLEGPSSS